MLQQLVPTRDGRRVPNENALRTPRGLEPGNELNPSYTRSYNGFSGVDIVAFQPDTEAQADVQAVSFTVTREVRPLYSPGSMRPRQFVNGRRGIAGTLIFLSLPQEFDTEVPFDISLRAVNEHGNEMMMRLSGCQVVGFERRGGLGPIDVDTTVNYVASEIVPWHRVGDTPPEPVEEVPVNLDELFGSTNLTAIQRGRNNETNEGDSHLGVPGDYRPRYDRR